MSPRILVVDDEPSVTDLLAYNLRKAQYDVLVAADGGEALRLARESAPDLILLDLMIPKVDGLDVCRELRKTSSVPIIMITARGEEIDRVVGLELGADDYVSKPFSVRELLARVEAVLRRSPERPGDVATVALPGGVADLARREVRFEDGGRQELSEREVELLRYLASNAGRAISREEILSRVWRLDPKGVETRTIDMHVARLREKLRDDPACPRVLLTVRGKGYMFAKGQDETGGRERTSSSRPRLW
jgi:DNA-binding response OmpR family regulator